MRTTRIRRWLGLLAAITLLAAACGDDSDDAGATSDSGSQESTSTAVPKAGGTLTYGVFFPLASFDPVTQIGSYGCCTGNELTAMYDTLLSFDRETGEYSGRLAESFEPNDDYTKWTLKLRSGVKFTDGTALDADAVKLNIERHAAPTSRSSAKGPFDIFLASVSVVDPTTVTFALKQAWTGFPAMLAREAGMIASPTAIQAAGANFATAPGNAGAGPFKLASFKPGESIEMVKNPDYYGGDVLLDGIRFITFGSEQANHEAIKSGDLDAMYVRSPKVMAEAEADGTEAVDIGLNPMGSGLIFNSGIEVTCAGGEPAVHCAGKADGTKVTTQTATADVKVRRAVAAAIDPDTINERAFGGALVEPTSELFPEPLPWAPDVPGPEYDPDAAKKLVEEAKAAGWNGKIRVRGPITSADQANAVAALLEAVGMDVDLNTTDDTANNTAAVLVKKDFDVSIWSLGLSDGIDNTYVQLLVSFGQTKRYGYNTAALTSALDEVRLATDNDERQAAMKNVETVLTDDVPLLSFYLGREQLLTSPDVRGIEVDAQARVNFDKVWVDR